jgi:hypothetical protein
MVCQDVISNATVVALHGQRAVVVLDCKVIADSSASVTYEAVSLQEAMGWKELVEEVVEGSLEANE